MYRRLYGIRHHGTARNLVPIENESWLQAKSLSPTVKYVLLGTACIILVTLVLFPLGSIGLVPEFIFAIMFLLCALAVMVALFFLLLLWIERSSRDLYQYCPDCLSYMTRGANVCPFCGFRPEPVCNAWQS